MEQIEHLEKWTGEDDNDYAQLAEDFEDYKANGGEMEYDEWFSDMADRAELQAELQAEDEPYPLDDSELCHD